MAVAFDEMGSGAAVRTPYSIVQDWLDATPAELFQTKRREAEILFRRIGITFAVYGDA